MPFRSAIEQILRSGTVPAFPLPAPTHSWGLEHAVSRLVTALRGSEFGLDHAVLLRQCIRMLPTTPPLVVERVPESLMRLLDRVRVEHRVDGVVEALPFSPEWLDEQPRPEVDAPAEKPVWEDIPISGEPWLKARLGKAAWKSQAQREATWRALNAPPNSTQLIGLPTGAGKSLVYQACAAYEDGLTVLIVPTVALGLDQFQAVSCLPFAAASRPLFFSADAESDAVLQTVSDRECRLLITSPEACVAGRLRAVLGRFAEEGWLRRIVVDEAHIIESWGASFRIEFQLLGSLVRSWRAAAPRGVRVLLLSATFTPATPTTLRTLFCDDKTPWDEFVVQRLRPEIRYFAPSHFVEVDLQQRAVLEALYSLPRPLILYVTERKEAERWWGQLKAVGFVRLACFHGDTPRPRRAEIMGRWRSDELDVVVATSAFGMGVDKADVRAIVHACYPENIDRFYQEVGRGGRDGAPSVSLVIATRRDFVRGVGMGPVLLTDPEKINGRWRALWRSREAAGSELSFRVSLHSQPNHRLGERSYGENIRWNKRLLMMMERAALIKVDGLEWQRPGPDGDAVEFAIVRPLKSTIELDSSLSSLLEGPRALEFDGIQRARASLDKVLQRVSPPCRLLRAHYGSETRRACGSCSFCRSGAEVPSGATDLSYVADAVPTRPAVDVVEAPNLRSPSGRSSAALALRQVLRGGIACRIVVGVENEAQARELLGRADDGVGAIYRLDRATQEAASSVAADEVVVVLHFDSIDMNASVFNHRGARCAHWVFGGPVERTSGRWPFLHEAGARLYSGSDAVDRWLANAVRPRAAL